MKLLNVMLIVAVLGVVGFAAESTKDTTELHSSDNNKVTDTNKKDTKEERAAQQNQLDKIQKFYDSCMLSQGVARPVSPVH